MPVRFAGRMGLKSILRVCMNFVQLPLRRSKVQHGTNCKKSAKPSDAYAESTAKSFGPVRTAGAQTGRSFWHDRARHQAQERKQSKQNRVMFPVLGLLATRAACSAVFLIAACARSE